MKYNDYMGRRAKLSTEQLDRALDRIEKGEGYQKVADEYGVTIGCLGNAMAKRRQVKKGEVLSVRQLARASDVVQSLRKECIDDYGRIPNLQEIRYWLQLDYLQAAGHGSKGSRILHAHALRMIQELDGLSEISSCDDNGRPCLSEFDVQVNRIKNILSAATACATLPSAIVLKEADGRPVKEISAPCSPKHKVEELTDEQSAKLNHIGDLLEEFERSRNTENA
jgi:hypothetical protein